MNPVEPEISEAEIVWHWLIRFLLVIAGTLLAATLTGIGLAMWKRGGQVHLW
jgi:hypothetical protein